MYGRNKVIHAKTFKAKKEWSGLDDKYNGIMVTQVISVSLAMNINQSQCNGADQLVMRRDCSSFSMELVRTLTTLSQGGRAAQLGRHVKS